MAIDNCDDLDLETKAKWYALLYGYDLCWGGQAWKTVAVEKEVLFEIPRTAWSFTAKIDTLATGEGNHLVMVEHKTTTQDLSKRTSVYFSKLSFDEQISRYHLAQWLENNPLDQTIYDVIRKISSKPKKLIKRDIKEIRAGSYCGEDVTDTTASDAGDLERENM
jgi:hypothetical protein